MSTTRSSSSTTKTSGSRPTAKGLPSALERLDELMRLARGKQPAVFLDYDGTLTPIVERPELAVLSTQMREAVEELGRLCTVAVISGRDLSDVRRLVGIESIFYAGSHGFDIAGPRDRRIESQQGAEFIPALDAAESRLRDLLGDMEGVLVERKRFSIAVHYRQVPPDRTAAVEEAVDEVAADHPDLRKGTGKKVFELQPQMEWHKGKAVLWLLEALELDRKDVLPIYIGDDVTDEDAFEALRGRGIRVIVRDDEDRPTYAQYALQDTEEVRSFLKALASMLEG